MDELRRRIQNKSARLAVIGLGYVGLPLASLFAERGFDVLGVDIRKDRVDAVNAGKCPIEGEEPGLAELIAQVVRSGRLHAAVDYGGLRDRDVVMIDVETPVDGQNIPRFDALRSALMDLRPVLKSGALVIVESTLAPGTMDQVVLPLLDDPDLKTTGRDFYLGHCPERVMPGRLLQNLRTVSRVVGGMTPETAAAMVDLYRHVVEADLDPTDCVTAELVKTTENAYRDVQIAFANEVALICDAVGADVWSVRELVNKSPMRHMHLPGPGVGGHCIPKDPWLLAYGAKQSNVPLHLIPAARTVNSYMPSHVIDLLRRGLASYGLRPGAARVLIMGCAYLENSDDVRNSPSLKLAELLRESGAEVALHDPYIEEYRGKLPELAQNADAVVAMVAHREYQTVDLSELRVAMRHPLLVDTRSIYTRRTAEQAGLQYVGLGKGLKP